LSGVEAQYIVAIRDGKRNKKADNEAQWSWLNEFITGKPGDSSVQERLYQGSETLNEQEYVGRLKKKVDELERDIQGEAASGKEKAKR
jgi:hypothetical protein